MRTPRSTRICAPSAVVAGVGRQPEVEVGVDGVAAVVLQLVGGELVQQADAAPLVAAQVDHDAAAAVGDGAQRGVQLRAAVAAQRAEHVAGQALGVHAAPARPSPAPTSPRTSATCSTPSIEPAIADREELAVPRRQPRRRPPAPRATRCGGGRRSGRRSTRAPGRASSANARSSGSRAIDPSSLTISAITPAGVSPARRARSTAASVCPARTQHSPGDGAQREDVARAGSARAARSPSRRAPGWCAPGRPPRCRSSMPSRASTETE